MSLDSWIADVVASIDEDDRVAFVLDPKAAASERFGLHLREVEDLAERRADGGFCDGASFLDDGVILFAPTRSSRRENFTIAHEVGHWLVQGNQRLFDWIADRPEAPAVLETVCDRVAQRLLLPDDLVDSVITARPVRARHVQELFDASAASLTACAIAIARQLPTMGAVVLLSRADHSVAHASIRPDSDDGWPTVFPWRGQALDGAHPLTRVSTGVTMTRRISWTNSWGARAEFFADAIADRTRVIAVLADDNLWKVEPGRVLEVREYDRRPAGTVYCCGRTQTRRGYPCPTCGEHFCGVCGLCRCGRVSAREQTCGGCFLQYQPHLLVDGRCEDCR